MDSRPAGSSPLTWPQFFSMFLEKYMLRSLRDRLRERFSRLEQGSMTVAEYEARFHELARHETSILNTE